MEWTLELKFRISGQGKNLFGDGLALWVTNTPYFEFSKGGSAFGVPETIKGFGILFDTYKNAEAGSKHKDIMLVNSDGDTPMQMHDPLPTGCRANYRLWEGRDDFNVKKHSIAVIDFKYDERKIKVRIDEKADGRLRDCFEFTFTDDGAARLADMSKMHIALSSSTGQLADNHDVLSVKLRTYGDAVAGRIEPMIDPSTLEDTVSVDTKSFVDAHVKSLQKRIADLEHELEHRMDAIVDELRATISKVQDAEEADRAKIDELTSKITDNVMREAASSIGDVVEEIVDDSVSKRMERQKRDLANEVRQGVQNHVMDTMSRVVDTKLGNISVSDKSWIMPFLVLCILMCIVSGVAYTKWNRYMKTHLP